MSECKYKAKDGECLYEKLFPYKEYCVEGPCPHDTPMTHGDKLRGKNDEELAQWIADISFCCPPGFSPAPLGCDDVCAECWLDWLRQEAKK